MQARYTSAKRSSVKDVREGEKLRLSIAHGTFGPNTHTRAHKHARAPSTTVRHSMKGEEKAHTYITQGMEP